MALTRTQAHDLARALIDYDDRTISTFGARHDDLAALIVRAEEDASIPARAVALARRHLLDAVARDGDSASNAQAILDRLERRVA